MTKDSDPSGIENTLVPFHFVKDHPQFEADGIKMKYAIGGSRALYLLSKAEEIQEVRYLDRAGNVTLFSNTDPEYIGIQKDRSFLIGAKSRYANNLPFTRLPVDIDAIYFSANPPADVTKFGDPDSTSAKYNGTLIDFSTSTSSTQDKISFGEKLLIVKCKNPETNELQDFLILHPDHLIISKLRHCFEHTGETEKPKFLPELELISKWYIESFSKEYLKTHIEASAANDSIQYYHHILSKETTAKYPNAELVIQSLLNSPEYRKGRQLFKFIPEKLQRRFGPLLKTISANEKYFTDSHISQIQGLGESIKDDQLYEYLIQLTSNINSKKLTKEVGTKMITFSLAWIGYSGDVPKEYDYIWSSMKGVDLINFIMDMEVPIDVKKALPKAISFALVENLSISGPIKNDIINIAMENDKLFQTIFSVLKQKQAEIVNAYRNKKKEIDPTFNYYCI
ncbi:MAG: hypothetical protein WCK31_05040, partial [bacterium]